MAYKFTKGKVYRGDIYNEDDVQQNTYLDWSEDAIGVVAGGPLVFAVSSSMVSSSLELSASKFHGDGSDLSNITATASPAGSDGQLQYNNGGSTGGAASLYWDDSNSRVGIGTSSPDYALDVAGNIGVDQKIYHNGDGNTYINFTDDRIRFTDGGLDLFGVHQKSSAPHQVTVNNGGNNVDFYVKDNNSDTILMTDASTRRVGIGTTSPSKNLDIEAADSAVIQLNATNYRSYNIGSDGYGFVIHDATTGGTAGYRFVISDIPAALGYVGIGAGASLAASAHPDALLHLSSSDDGQIFRADTTDGTTVLFATGSGRVGIGTDSPEAYLDIKNTTDDGANNRTMIQLYNYRTDDADTNDWAPTSIDFKIENVAGGVKGATARIATVIAPVGTGHNTTEGEKSSALIFSTMDDATLSEATRINNLGHVGIGTNSPESTLTVSGSVAAAITSFTGTSNTLSAAHHTVLMGSDNNSCTVTLPAAAGCTGRIYVIKRIGSSGTYTIAPQSGETIDGNGGDFTAWSSDQNNIVMIQSDGSNWWILSEAHMGEGGG